MNKTLDLPVFLVAIVAIGLGLAFLPQWGGLWAILTVSVLMVSGGRGPGFLMAITVSVIAATLLVLKAASLPFFLLSVFPGSVAGYMISRHFSFGKVLAGGFAAGLTGFGMLWLFQFYLQSGQLSMHAVEQLFIDYFNYIFLPTLEASGLSEYYNAQGLTLPFIEGQFDKFMASLAGLRPGLYVFEAWVRILLGVVLGRFLLRDRHLVPVPPFTKQRMAWHLDWVIIAGLAMWLSGLQWNLGLINQIGANLLFLMVPIAFYFGLSLTTYLVKHWKIRRWVTVVVFLIAISLPLQACLFITVLGVFDPLIDYRNLDGKRGSPA